MWRTRLLKQDEKSLKPKHVFFTGKGDLTNQRDSKEASLIVQQLTERVHPVKTHLKKSSPVFPPLSMMAVFSVRFVNLAPVLEDRSRLDPPTPRCAFREHASGSGTDQLKSDVGRLMYGCIELNPVSVFGLRCCFHGVWPARMLRVGPETIEHCNPAPQCFVGSYKKHKHEHTDTSWDICFSDSHCCSSLFWVWSEFKSQKVSDGPEQNKSTVVFSFWIFPRTIEWSNYT